MDTNEGRVYFALDSDDFDPDDEVTEFIEIEPTSIKNIRIVKRNGSVF